MGPAPWEVGCSLASLPPFVLIVHAGYSVREELPLPDKPPYTVHLGNLSFDATIGDVTDFFAGCECTNVRIIEDKLEMKPKGFGYAEFATLDGLKQALTLNGSQFQGRNIRISVADPRTSLVPPLAYLTNIASFQPRTEIAQTQESSVTGAEKDPCQTFPPVAAIVVQNGEALDPTLAAVGSTQKEMVKFEISGTGSARVLFPLFLNKSED
jgi:RNA recognition motif-containing protein